MKSFLESTFFPSLDSKNLILKIFFIKKKVPLFFFQAALKYLKFHVSSIFKVKSKSSTFYFKDLETNLEN